MNCKDCIHCNVCVHYFELYKNLGSAEIVRMIDYNCKDYIPESGVVEVVRCKDCEHWHYTGKGLLNERVGICSNDDFPFHCEQRPITRETDFCSYGERRKDAD